MKTERKLWTATLVLIIIVCIGWSSEAAFEGFEGRFVAFDKVDVIYYINLDHRKDRNREILNEFKKMSIPEEKIVRISAIKDVMYGDLGCSKSHIEAMKKFKASGKNNCIIFEDDFMFSQSKHIVYENMQKLFDQKVDYDVCMLSANTIENEDSKYSFFETCNQFSNGIWIYGK